MKVRWLVVAGVGFVVAAFALSAAEPALARAKRRPPPVCIDPPASITLGTIFFNTRPEPNGCAPPVYANGQYVGQDPDPFIRQYLRHDPQSGYDGPQ